MRVGVMRGGISDEYDISLKTGGAVLKVLAENGGKPRDILITKDGTWHLDGVPVVPENIARQVDVMWNGLHGEYGEDGKVQQLLETLKVPYTGSRPFASALGMNKQLSKRRFLDAGLLTPQGFVVNRGERGEDTARSIFQKMAPPYIVKPLTGGSSIGVVMARTPGQLAALIAGLLASSESIIVEEYIRGREVVAGAVEVGDGMIHSLRPLSVTLPDGEHVFTQNLKHSPGDLYAPVESRAQHDDIAYAMRTLARELSIRHYFTADFISSPHGLYILEVNTLPGLSSTSAFSRMLHEQDSNLGEFVEHMLLLALEGK